MSDTGRQSMTDKMGSSMKPDSQKGMMEQTGDKMKGAMDSAASMMQPDSQKSGSQRAVDSMSGNNDNTSMLSKAKNAVGMGNNNNTSN